MSAAQASEIAAEMQAILEVAFASAALDR
jgi:hypothetical protein